MTAVMTAVMTAPVDQPPPASEKPADTASEKPATTAPDGAAATPATGSARRSYALGAAFGGLTFASFYPLDWGFLAWVALLPLLALVPDAAAHRYRAAFVGGLVWTLPQLQWMRLASPPMYVAWIALAVYVACYPPALIAIVRVGLRTLSPGRRVDLGSPLLPIVVGLAWTALEYVRAHLMTGFAWYFLGHSQHRFETLAQIADLGGVYAISLVVASLAGVVAMRWAGSGEASQRRARLAVTLGWIGLMAASLGYGSWRLGGDAFPAGPRVALVQGNFTSSLKSDPARFDDIYRTHRELTAMATGEQPDLILWPETMMRYPLLRAESNLDAAALSRLAPQIDPTMWGNPATDRGLRDLAAMSGADLLLGGEVLAVADDGRGLRRYNAAIAVGPDDGPTDWYAKLHRVPFGEYVPLLETLAPDWVAQSGVPNIAPGDAPRLVEVAGLQVLPVICFEDTVPHRVRRSAVEVGGEVDLIANLTNDGWFHGSSELDQHLAISTFRAIELRTPLVRAANTGISAIIDGNGRVVEPDTLLSLDGRDRSMRTAGGTYERQFDGVLIGDLPLDPRTSVYQRIGDWLGLGSLLLTAMLLAAAVVTRRPQPAIAA